MGIQRWVRCIFPGGFWGYLSILVIAAFLLTTAAVLADDWYVYPPYPLENERFGVGMATSAESVLRYDLEALGASWYLNWNVALNPPHPNGVAFLQNIRFDAGNLSSIHDRETILAAIEANPGAIWQLGNEPDSIWLDNCTPEQYARAYHEYYHLIQAYDPTARVAFGGLVQATPLRMLYLEHAWQAYQNLYGVEMPVDVWVVHGFVFPEVRGGWGADIPPGMGAYAHLGKQYEIRDHDDMTIFAEQIVRFRQWMANHGQRDKPLLVNEYGITIWPDIWDEDGRQFTDERVVAFMHATFDYFLTATDPNLGYPADGDRLVQGWAWYSLDDNIYHNGQVIGEGYNGDLFTGAYTKTMTALGQGYADYVHNQVGIGPDYTDLYPLRLQADPAAAMWGETETITLTAEIANYGRQPVQAVEVRLWEGNPDAGGTLVIPPQIIHEVPGRYEGTGVISATWTPPASGSYTFWVEVDPADAVVESNEGNNRLSQTVLVATTRLYLPVVLRGSGSG